MGYVDKRHWLPVAESWCAVSAAGQVVARGKRDLCVATAARLAPAVVAKIAGWNPRTLDLLVLPQGTVRPVSKAIDPMDPDGFERIVANVSTEIRRAAGQVTAPAIGRMLQAMDVN